MSLLLSISGQVPVRFAERIRWIRDIQAWGSRPAGASDLACGSNDLYLGQIQRSPCANRRNKRGTEIWVACLWRFLFLSIPRTPNPPNPRGGSDKADSHWGLLKPKPEASSPRARLNWLGTHSTTAKPNTPLGQPPTWGPCWNF